MLQTLKNNLAIIVLLSISLFVCYQNYTPGTILSGWDTLHPEFNFGLALKREIFGLFRSYQGLGAVAAHSDMADIPRIVLLAILDLFLPVAFLRYSYIFLALILGPIGMYLILYKHVLKDKTSSFLGALFYLLNLGTMQQFAVPFEMFVTQYAALPWLFLFATDYLIESRQSVTVRANPSNAEGESRTPHENILLDSQAKPDRSKNKKVRSFSLLFFAITTILAAPQAYAATLWYIYFIAFILYLVSLALFQTIHLRGATSSHLGGGPKDSSEVNPERFSLLKKAFTLILLTLLLNSFWILPNIYYIFTHGSQVPQANINKLFSEQAFLYNKEFGNIKDIAMLKSFLFDWNVYALNNHFTQLLSPWIQHLKQPFIESLGYLFAFVSLCGIIYSIFNPFDPLREASKLRVNKILLAFLPLLFLCLFFLLNDNPPTSPLYSFLREHLSFFKEAYRFPQDKVRGVYTFVFAVYFGAGQLLITGFLATLTMKQFNNLTMQQSNNEISRPARTISKTELAQIVIFTLAIFYFMLPAFKGQLISPYMRIKIPNFYFEMFKWFDNMEEDARVANLPIHSFWGWDYYNWFGSAEPSFQGAGFIWFGIKQPVLARDFDRWSPYNEQYYREMSYAIYSKDPQALRLTIEKYNIKYILLDKNIIAPPNPSKVLLYEETQALLEKQEFIQKVKEFGNTLIVYKIKSNIPNSHYVVRNPFYIYPESQVFYEDQFFKDYGNYAILQDGVYYPFVNLIDNQSKVLPNILKITQEGVIINLPKENFREGWFTLPSYLDAQESLPSDLLIQKDKDQLDIAFYPRLPTVNTKDRPIPIVAKVPLQSGNIMLSINKKDNFILNTSLSNTPLSLGVVFLTTKNDNTIAIYPSIPNEQILPDLSTTNYYIEPCEDIGGQKIFGAELIENNSFYIFGKNVHLCMTIPLSKLLQGNLKSKQVLLNVKFNYSSSLPLKFCIAKLTNGACQNYRSDTLSTYVGINNKDIQTLGLQFQLDTTESRTIEKALYSNLSLTLTYPSFSTSLPNPSVPSMPSNPSSLIVPFSGNQQFSAKITEFPRTTGLCPNQPSNNPSIIKKENNDDFIRYVSQEGMACDHFSYQNLFQNEAYLIAITSRNIKGLPLTICVANQVSKHCDIYTSLSSSRNFTTDIFLLPSYIKNESGFDVNIRNLGIKKTPAINDLKSIEIIPFPYRWLTQIKESKTFYSSSDPELAEGESRSNNETVRQSNNNLLVLPQSFEKGWKAYQVKSSSIRQAQDKVKSWINRTFPFLFGQELKEHVLVNSWANGWIVNDSKLSAHSSQFIVIFVPQYLEYLGFVLLAGAIVYIVKTKGD